ncbi:cadherin-like beta sandwich domain-containing protein [Ferruginibacter sp.]|nr:T9SS type A sorting domain-containing protein [Ferruginibacter sp.]
MRKLFTIKLLLLAFTSGIAISSKGQTNPAPQALPYNQNFSTFTGSTTVYPAGIQGWGFGTTAISTSFNIAAPTADQALAGTTNATTSGFVGDMNGKIGVLATGSNIKAICLAINTTSLTNISVSFLAATQRQVVTERVNELGVQYRIGTSGTFTNIAASTYQNNLAVANTTGTGSVNPVTVNFTLPAACINQPIVQLRWIQRDVSGAGGRPSFSIDDIAISGSPLLSSNADLSNLTLSTGALSPVFAAATTSYTASVANAVASITATPTSSDANSTITVNGNAVTSGNPSASIPLNVGANIITTVVTAQDAVTTKTYTVTVTRAAAGVANVLVTTSLPDFGAVCINTTTSANSFKITGTDLNGSNIELAALPGFTYCETAGGTYTTTLSFTYTAPGFTDKEIFVKFNPTAVQSYNGDISLSGGGLATSVLVPATGSGVNTALTITTGASSAIAATTATAAGTINVTGCTTITAYGIEYSTTTGFINGSGTQVAASNLSAGNFSANLTSLAPNTRYYYKAYATDGSGTTYGIQQAFTCTALPVPMALQSGLSYTETFADIANWSNFFITGTGANHFSGLGAIGAGGIPNGTTLTASTLSFQPGTPGTSGGVQKGTDQAAPIPTTQSIILLSTGSSDNTTSSAIDFYLDFTGVNAGTLSFDYQSFSNALSTGANDRAGSLRVYTSTDGIAFTELTNVVNFINNTPISGSKTNIPLPASFNNSATARLRFYYHNGTGGTNGSRPKMSIDNLNVTAVATTPCVSPTAPATALTFGTITDVSIAGSFTAATPAANEYLVVMSTSSSLNGSPIDGVIYNVGDNVGDGSVVARGNTTGFTATGLTALTTYYFFIFPLNSVCTGGPLYYTSSVLNGNATTIAGLPPCAAPAAQPTTLVLNSPAPTINTIQGSFTATTADEYLILRSTSNTLSNTPVNAQVYNAGDILGNAVVVQRSAATTFTANGLSPATQYYFFVFSLNSQACISGPVYNIVSPLTGTETTQPLPPCAAPLGQPISLVLTAANTSVSATFTGIPSADDYLVVRSLSPTLSATPVDNTDYNVGDNFGGGIVVANSSTTSFLATGLTPNTTYYFYVFAANKNCSGGTKYATAGPLTGNIVTTNVLANNYYFGTLHSHSDYSDGNKDNPGYTPAQDYAYAKTALCMDYLGISEHNHFSGGDPGNLLSTYHQGATQADAFSTANPTFLALYGMEWGTISGGGHVLIYGNGMDNLWGWESGSGAWGASNNYDVYVQKSVYTGTGLFKAVNDNIATNTFASLAHPNLTDFNNIAGIAYDAAADSAISATTVESGPSSSTNTTYTAPGSSMAYLWYYQMLLAKGYHLGPTIDHDNHYTTFGKTTYSRTAIVAPSLTKAAIMNAVRNMNFYATQDCDSKVDFTINTRILGSIFTDRFAPNISVTLTDATTSTTAAVIRLMYGVPGSGVLPVKIDSAIGSTLSFTDASLANLATGYYYIDITNGTSRVVTSPIWYTRNDAAGGPLPVKLNSFVVQKIDNSAKVSWSTEEENNSSHFIVERSVDGRTWNTIATVTAAGNSSHRIDYSIIDNAPMRGINYYRLKQVDKDAKYDYSAIKSALFNSRYTAEVAPNPAKDFINVYMTKTGNGNQQATVQLLNTGGKLVYQTATTQSHLQINTAGMGKGLYLLKVVDADNVTTIKVIVQ